MSRFYASINGAKGEATRQGSASSGIIAHPRGWELGVRVTGMTASAVDGDAGKDAFVVDITGGTNDGGKTRYGVLTVSEERDGWRRLVVSADPHGFVCYLPPDGGPAVSRMPADA
jgi:hypothetical protein